MGRRFLRQDSHVLMSTQHGSGGYGLSTIFVSTIYWLSYQHQHVYLS